MVTSFRASLYLTSGFLDGPIIIHKKRFRNPTTKLTLHLSGISGLQGSRCQTYLQQNGLETNDVTLYHPSVRNLKNILMQNWNLIQNQPLLKNIFKDPPIISYKRGQSLKDMLVRAKI